MFLPALFALAITLVQTPMPVVAEPDGSRAVGPVPSFRGEPAPPEWLRKTSHDLAAVDTAHYIYEVYAGPGDQWLVRYVMLPEGDEAFRDIEQVLIFTGDRTRKPRTVNPTEVTFTVTTAALKAVVYQLVDHRELLRP
jgi:hypothetical protein